VSAKEAPGRERGWRNVLLSQDAEAIWYRLSILVRAAAPNHAAGYDHLTQELFLSLLTSNRIDFYLENEYSDEQIRADLIEMLRLSD
jgi:hypothetical protein